MGEMWLNVPDVMQGHEFRTPKSCLVHVDRPVQGHGFDTHTHTHTHTHRHTPARARPLERLPDCLPVGLLPRGSWRYWFFSWTSTSTFSGVFFWAIASEPAVPLESLHPCLGRGGYPDNPYPLN